MEIHRNSSQRGQGSYYLGQISHPLGYLANPAQDTSRECREKSVSQWHEWIITINENTFSFLRRSQLIFAFTIDIFLCKYWFLFLWYQTALFFAPKITKRVDQRWGENVCTIRQSSLMRSIILRLDEKKEKDYPIRGWYCNHFTSRSLHRQKKFSDSMMIGRKWRYRKDNDWPRVYNEWTSEEKGNVWTDRSGDYEAFSSDRAHVFVLNIFLHFNGF